MPVWFAPLRALAATFSDRMPATPTDGVSIIESAQGSVRMRMHLPDEVRTDAALVWVHGGGLILGSPRQDDPLAGGTAAELGMPVFAARYRVAPRGRFPGALDDVIAVWDAVQAQAEKFGIDPARVVIGGESAGGGLAAAAAQRLHDRAVAEGTPEPLGQWLFAPMLDDRTAADLSLDAPAHPVWTNRANRTGWRQYLGAQPGTVTPPPYAVPARRDDLSGLPSAFITWGDIELFAAEDAAYAARLAAAGVEVTTDIVAGAPHGFENWARHTEPAQALLERARDWLATRVGVERIVGALDA